MTRYENATSQTNDNLTTTKLKHPSLDWLAGDVHKEELLKYEA